ncbi:MAG: BMP family protein [Dehalococcoidia bacterium]|tara:strand:+ start:3693 stop:4937 length:1245 start_codon:yes stop_codon:yes gene_type:complete
MVSSLKKMKLIAISATLSALIATVLACNIGGEADSANVEPMASEPIKFGMILVGPRNDRGWSQAHYDGGAYAAEKTGSEMIVMDFINPADSPDITVAQVVDQMVEQGAELIFATSEDMKDGVLEAAAANPEVPMIWSSGDSAWSEGDAHHPELANLGNIMGKMEYGKMMAGCAAALKTETGNIGFVGPLINAETKRLANSAYLGAKYCWEESRGKNISDLNFEVKWIGFWFHIPGVTLDPTVVTNDFYDSGADVVISGIDTTQVIVEAGKRNNSGEQVWAVPYDYHGACAEAPGACLGVPYFNWGPSYLNVINAVANDNFSATWEWLGPDWSDINNVDTSMIGFAKGDALSDSEWDTLNNQFIKGLANGDINLFEGPLNYQDGSVFVAAGQEASEKQIWYTTGLLEGIIGDAGD